MDAIHLQLITLPDIDGLQLSSVRDRLEYYRAGNGHWRRNAHAAPAPVLVNASGLQLVTTDGPAWPVARVTVSPAGSGGACTFPRTERY